MKSSRKYILAVCTLALGFAAPLVRAEDTPPPAKKEHPKGDRVAELKEKLGLTDDQAAQLKKIFADERDEMKALREKDLPKEEKKAEAIKIREATRTKVEAVLTAEQKAKFAQMRKDHEEKGPKGDK